MITHRGSFLTVVVLIAALTACQVAPRDPGVTVSVTPSTEVLEPGASAQFAATVAGTTDTAVTWSTTCGEIVGSGQQVTYVAPSEETECVLTATSVAFPAASGSATITVAAAVPEVGTNTQFDEPVADTVLGSGESIFFRVNIPSGQRGADRRLVIEADDDGGARQLDLVLFEPDGTTPTASTSGTAFFRPGLAGIDDGDIGSALRTAVERAVRVTRECIGPCISRGAPTGLTHVYVELTNRGPSTQTIDIYAYTEQWIDEGEPANDEPAGAVPVSAADAYSGAIEELGDEDWVTFTEAGTITLAQRDGYDLNIRMEIYDAGAQLVATLRPGESFAVLDGDVGVIDHDPEAPTRASVYGFYTVFYDSP